MSSSTRTSSPGNYSDRGRRSQLRSKAIDVQIIPDVSDPSGLVLAEPINVLPLRNVRRPSIDRHLLSRHRVAVGRNLLPNELRRKALRRFLSGRIILLTLLTRFRCVPPCPGPRAAEPG